MTRATVPPATVRVPAARDRAPWTRAAVGLGLVLALGVGVALASLLGSDGGGSGSASRSGSVTPDATGSGERRGDPITMRTVPGGRVMANAQLVSYDNASRTLQLQLTPLGPSYHRLLFDDLDAVRRFEALPESALQILSAGPGGALTTGAATEEPGTTGAFAVTMPANFRRHGYFGVIRTRGQERRLEVYDRFDRLPDPS